MYVYYLSLLGIYEFSRLCGVRPIALAVCYNVYTYRNLNRFERFYSYTSHGVDEYYRYYYRMLDAQ